MKGAGLTRRRLVERFDVGDVRAVRPNRNPTQQLVYGRGRSLGDDLNPSIGKVAHPAGEPEVAGNAPGRRAKENTLHPPRHEEVHAPAPARRAPVRLSHDDPPSVYPRNDVAGRGKPKQSGTMPACWIVPDL